MKIGNSTNFKNQNAIKINQSNAKSNQRKFSKNLKTIKKMSKGEIKLALYTIEKFVDKYEEEETKSPTKTRCKKFFEIIHKIRLATQVMTELLKRIENLEQQINNLKLEKNEQSSNNNI